MEQLNAVYSYRWLNFRIKLDKGRTRRITEYAVRNTQYRPKTWRCMPKCTNTEENVAAVEMTLNQEGRHTPDIERDGSLSLSSVVVILRRDIGLKCLKRCHAQELNEGNHRAIITPDSCSPNSRDLNPVNYIWGIIYRRVYRTKVQDVNDSRQHLLLICGLEWNTALFTMPLALHKQWRRRTPVPAFESEEDILNNRVTQISQNVVYWSECINHVI